jgi:hypothetical protein
MTRDDRRLLLIGHALSGAALQTKDAPAELARRAVQIASAVLDLLRSEEECSATGLPANGLRAT